MMLIKRMEKEDIDGVFNIENECFSHPWSKEDLEKQLDLDTSVFLVAKENNDIVGYMGVQIFSGEGYVTNVATLPEFRRMGVARALIQEVLKHEMEFLTLEVRESNTPAINLYKSLEFVEVGKRPRFYREPTEDAVLMTRYKNEQRKNNRTIQGNI